MKRLTALALLVALTLSAAVEAGRVGNFFRKWLPPYGCKWGRG